MTGDLDVCAAALYRAVGKDVLTADEFVMDVSLKQKWMSPSDAKALLGLMVRSRILEQKDGYLRPLVDLSAVDVPLAYRPPKDLLSSGVCEKPSEPATDMFPKLMDVASDAGMHRREFIQECNRIQKRLDIDVSVAALIVMRENGIAVDPFIEGVYRWVSRSGITPS